MDIIEVTGVILATVVGIVSLVLSIRNEKKLASKEHELAEGLKADILQLLAIFSSILYKNRLATNLPNDISIEDEIKDLSKLRLTGGYIYLINRIQNRNKRLLCEIRFQLIILNGQVSLNHIGGFAWLLIETLHHLRNDEKLGEEIPVIVENMYNDEFLKESNTQILSEFERFVYYIVGKKITDPDVLLYCGVFENDADIVKKALDDGADKKCTEKMIIERYENEYKEFLNNQSR